MIFNLLCILTAFGLLGLSVYIYKTTNTWDAYSITFMASSGVLFFFSGCAINMRRSIHMLYIYLSILFIFILGFIVVDAMFLINSDVLVDLAVTEYLAKNPAFTK